MNARKQIIESIFILLNKYPMDKITVDMIAEQCEMSRASFYRYYQDKYQLMTMAYVFYAEKLAEKDLNNRDWLAALEKILQFMFDNRKAFENMFKVEGQDAFYKALYANNLHMLREHYMKIKGITKLTPYEAHLLEFYITGMTNYEKQWVRGEIDLSPKEVAQIISDGMPDVIKSVLM